ncbi:hypothetical protein DdX_05683 [Ditylenchus destructor]|uniref:Uncharacterized protein n=1 Tax=Ditylenchus destructor TaxID=166010 RepID=A0AAD4RA73_9BILA|nr:hypothetical protein DdX_05683 [Ditylenchus destructor]
MSIASLMLLFSASILMCCQFGDCRYYLSLPLHSSESRVLESEYASLRPSRRRTTRLVEGDAGMEPEAAINANLIIPAEGIENSADGSVQKMGTHHLIALMRPDYLFRNAANIIGGFFDTSIEKQQRKSRAGAYLSRQLRSSLIPTF